MSHRALVMVLPLMFVACEIETPQGPPCSSTAECCGFGPAALCGDHGCEHNPFCANDPNCFGSRFGQCTATGPSELPGPSGGTCATRSASWFGAVLCYPLTPHARSVADRLQALWGQGPSIICSYDAALPGSTACGPFTLQNAVYCPLDDSISWDAGLLNQLHVQHGELAAIVFVAHEWGHMNQARNGLLGPQSTKPLELHADCQAGIFVAYEEARGAIDAGDATDAFEQICRVGDPFESPWFAPGAHGTCQERQAAFAHGYTGAWQSMEPLCTSAPYPTMLALCGG